MGCHQLLASAVVLLLSCRGHVIEHNRVPQTYEDRQALVAHLVEGSGGDVAALVEAVRKHDSSEHEDVARDMYALVRRAGLESSAPAARQLCTNYFLEKVKTTPGYLRGLALTFLQEFHREDFSDQGRQQIGALLDELSEPDLVRVAGIAEATNTQTKLKTLAARPLPERSEALSVSLAWQASLALARMGDDAGARRAVVRVLAESDTVVRSTVMFADLAFTRHPIAYEALIGFLDSTERRPTLKESQTEGQSEASAAAALLAEHLVGAPEVDDLPDEERVAELKAWLAKHSHPSIAR